VVKIYISSTYEDLKDYREAVYRALRRDRHDVIAMEDYVATDKRPLQKCLKDVASCDIYIGIFAWRYGFIPDDEKDNPNRLSITELEYRKAKEKGVPCLIFLLNKDEWPLRFSDGTLQSGTKGDNINRLRNELKNGYISSFFENKDQLAGLVLNAVHQATQKPLEVTSAAAPAPANTSSSLFSMLLQKPLTFKGEKSFFVGREDYINNLIKDQIQVPSSIVCIVGPGGSGKSQLAFKAIRQYEKEGMFDLVVPVYFSDVSLMSLLGFLLNIAKSFIDVNDMQIFEKMNIEDQKTVIYNFLSQRKKHPLLFVDNYETVSYILNDERQTTTEQYEEAVKISNYLNNDLPPNISVLVTSRERNNNFDNKERRIDLAGLQEQETIELFSNLTRDGYLRNIDNIMKDPDARSAIEKIFKMTGGHPLAVEIIAKNTSNINQINQLADTLGLGIVNTNEPDKRFRSLEACFDYTIKRLPEEIKKLLYSLTIFKSPFPMDVAEKVFNKDINFIIELYNRSLLLEIKSETSFGEISSPKYWLYSIHPAIRNYLEKTIEKAIGKTIYDLKVEYGAYFYTYNYDILFDVYNSMGKDVHRSSMAKFNLIYNQGTKDNDFDRAIKFAEDNNDLWYCANISRAIGLILQSFGMLSKALEYHFKSLGFNQRLNDKNEISSNNKDIGLVYNSLGSYSQALQYHNNALEIDTELNDGVRLARDYKNIGVAYWNMGNYEQALEYHNKALEIDTELNDKVGLAKGYRNIGLVYYRMGNLQQALEYHNKALEIDTELNNRVEIAADYTNIGLVYSNMGNYEQALKYHNKALDIDTELNNRVGLAEDYRCIGIAYYDMGNNEQALTYYYKALEIDTELNNRVGLAKDHYILSFPLYMLKKKKQALEHLFTAKTILLDFQKETGYSHPLLKDVEDGILKIEQDKRN
jgi:tetratricopeptide (TPR) repeat protein